MGAMSPPKRQEEHEVSKCSFRGCQKMRFGTLDFVFRFLSTTLVRELRFSGQRTPVLEVRRVVVSTIRPNQTFGCMCLLCVPLTFALLSGHFVVHPRNTSGCKDKGVPKTIAATMPPPPSLSPRVCVCVLTVS